MSIGSDDPHKAEGWEVSQSRLFEKILSSSDEDINAPTCACSPISINTERIDPGSVSSCQDRPIELKDEVGNGKGRLQFLTGYLNVEEKHGEKLERLCWILECYSSRQQAESETGTPCLDVVRKLFSIQKKFIYKLQERLSGTTDDRVKIGDIFNFLAIRHEALMAYLQCMPKFMDLLENPPGNRHALPKPDSKKLLTRTEHTKRTPTNNTARIKQDLQDPTTWVAQTAEQLQRLIELSPRNHPDIETLRSIHHAIVKSFEDQHPVKQLFNQLDQGNVQNPLSHLKLYNLVVEWMNPPADQCKLRFLMVFSKLLVCAKIKQAKTQNTHRLFERVKQVERQSVWRGSEADFSGETGTAGGELTGESGEGDQQQQHNIRLEARWSIPFSQLKLQKGTRFGTDSLGMLNQRVKIDELKYQITQLRKQRKLAKGVKRSRMDAQILKLEFELMLQTPQMAINLSDGQGHNRVLLMATERERDDWMADLTIFIQKSTPEAVGNPLLQDVLATRLPNTPLAPSRPNQDGILDVITESKRRSSFSRQLPSLSEITQWIKKYQHLVRLKRTGLVVVEDECDLKGILCLKVLRLSGLDSSESYHICVESDAFGQLEEVARTRVCLSNNPEWNQSFDIQIDGVQQLCLSLYCHCDVLAVFDVAVDKDTLTEAAERRLKAQTKGSEPKPVVLTCSWKLLSSAEVYPRTSSQEISSTFGRELKDLIKSDVLINSSQDNRFSQETHHKVPQVVKACVEEIERRGLKEVGIYRICGSTTDIQNLKKAIDSNQRQGLQTLSMFEIFVVTSTLKLFFQQLPTALLIEAISKELNKAVEIKEQKMRMDMIVYYLQQLPEENQETFEYLIKHFLNVARYRKYNKMDIGNLALIWSAALFQAPSSEDSPNDSNMEVEGISPMFKLIKHAAMGSQHTKVLHTILSAVDEGDIRLPLSDHKVLQQSLL